MLPWGCGVGGGTSWHGAGILRVLMLVVASCWRLERGWHQDLLIAFLTDFAVALKRISSRGESGRLAGVDFLCRVTEPHFIAHGDSRATPAAVEQSQHRRLSQETCSWAGGAGHPGMASESGSFLWKALLGSVLTPTSLLLIPLRLRGNSFSPEEMERLSHRDARLLL